MEYGFFMMPYCHGEARLMQHKMIELDLTDREGVHAYFLSSNKLPDEVKVLLAPSNLAYSMMDNHVHMRDHLTVFKTIIGEHREQLTPEILEHKFNEFETKLYESVLKEIDAEELKRCAAISSADETYHDQQDFSRCIKRKFGKDMDDQLEISVMDLIYRDAGIRWRMHLNCIKTKVFAFENSIPESTGYNKIALYFPKLKERELMQMQAAENASANADIKLLLTKIRVTYGLDNHDEIQPNDCFVMFHFLKMFIFDFEQLVASVKSALTKLYGKQFCDYHFRDGCVIDGSCSNLSFSSDDIHKSKMPILVSYGDANSKDPVANLLMKTSGNSKATIISFDIKERDAVKTIPYSRRTDASASDSATSASPARPTQLRFVVIPSTLESFVPPKMLMNGFNLPSVQPRPYTSSISMETVGSISPTSIKDKRRAVSPVSVGNSSDDDDSEFNRGGSGLGKKRRKTKKTTIRTKHKPNKTKNKPKNKSRGTHKKHIQTNIKNH